MRTDATHWRCRLFAWLYMLADSAPWVPRVAEGMHGPGLCDDHPGCRTTRWSILVDWLFTRVCEDCDTAIFGT